VKYRWEPDLTLVTDPLLMNAGVHNVPTQYTLFDKNENPVKTVATYGELITIFLNKLAASSDKTLVVVDETGAYSDGVAFATGPNIRRAFVFHNTFLADANDINGRIDSFFENVCANRELFDGLVFLTKFERDDFAKRYGSSEKYHVIPHAYDFAAPRVPFEDRNGKKAVIVSRFDSFKRIETAVEIFKLVTEKLPDVTLDIYGFGAGALDKTESIRDAIERLELTDCVFMKGPASNPAAVFSDAAMFMMTSSREGFGLTLMESICNGCPAFAFDIKYGPSDIIKNGETGFLIENKDVETYAAKMVEFLSDESLRRKMSDNCYDDAARFGKEKFLDNWAKFLEEMYIKGRCM